MMSDDAIEVYTNAANDMLFFAIENDDINEVALALEGELDIDPNAFSKPILQEAFQKALEKAHAKKYGALVKFLEAGFPVPDLEPDLILAPTSARAAITDLFIVAGAQLPYDKAGGDYPTYAERIDEGKAPLPTVQSLKENYGIDFDLDQRKRYFADTIAMDIPDLTISIPVDSTVLTPHPVVQAKPRM